MTQVVYLDTDAIINAIKAGRAAGDPNTVLDTWLEWAQQEGAQIKITDVVVGEVVSEAAALETWMDANGILETPTDPSLGGTINAGEKSILCDISQSDPTGTSSQFISDNTGDLKNSGFIDNAFGRVGSNAEIDVPSFINDRVMTSSEALNIAATKTGASFDEYSDLTNSYRQI